MTTEGSYFLLSQPFELMIPLGIQCFLRKEILQSQLFPKMLNPLFRLAIYAMLALPTYLSNSKSQGEFLKMLSSAKGIRQLNFVQRKGRLRHLQLPLGLENLFTDPELEIKEKQKVCQNQMPRISGSRSYHLQGRIIHVTQQREQN